MQTLHDFQIDPIVQIALKEDLGHGDWTTDLCVPAKKQSKAHIITREPCCIAGVELVERSFKLLDPSIEIKVKAENGAKVSEDTVIFEITGLARSILKSERVALNFFARTCGIATQTRKFVDAIASYETQILDTRKTTPGLRLLEKHATSIGGARNHRFGLSDGVIVKENHINAAGGISAAVDRLKQSLSPTIKIEVEVSNFNELDEALEAGADIVMLDNMSISEMELAVKRAGGRALLEASGGIKLDTIQEVAKIGVDYISTSATIAGAMPTDLSLLIIE